MRGHATIIRILAVVLALTGWTAAFAQEAAPPAAVLPDSPEAAQALVARLSDEEVRRLLLERLEATAPSAETPAPPAAGSVIDRTVDLFIATFVRLGRTIAATPDAIAASFEVMGTRGGSFSSDRVLRLILGLVAGTAAGLAVFVGVRRLLPDRPLPIAARAVAGPAIVDYLRDLVGLAAGFVVLNVVVHHLVAVGDVALGRMLAMWLVLVPLFVLRTLAILFAPWRPAHRLAYVDDRQAKALFFHCAGLVLAICLAKVAVAFLTLDRVTPHALVIGFWVNILIFLWFGYIILTERDALRRIMRGPDDNLAGVDHLVARHYPTFAGVVIVATWLAGVLLVTAGLNTYIEEGRHILTMAVLLVAPLFDTAVRSAAKNMSPPPTGDGEVAMAAYASSVRSLTRIGRAVVIGVTLLLLTRVWQLPVFDAAKLGIGAQLAERVLSAAYIGIAGYFLWELTRLWFNRKLSGEQTARAVNPLAEDSAGVELSPGSSRLATVLPVISWTLQAAIVVVTVLMVLSNIGIDVTALMAGAGIVGLALGFGSQKLVSDVVSGLFFLMEDAFRIGEYVEVGSVEGTIEKFSLRSLQLRAPRGAVYCIPYSQIPRVTNYGRDWGIMKMRFTVPFGTDVEKVRKIFKRIGQEMLANPALAPGFIEPFKSQGVREINSTGIVVGGKFTFRPGAQFTIRREVFKRVQEEFENAGIAFARQEVRVAVVGAGGTEVSDPAVAGAAATAAIAAAQPPAKA